MKNSTKLPPTLPSVHFEFIHPDDRDGIEMWKVVNRSGVLDENSSYSYLMMAKFFKDTCMVAKHKNEIAGFVTAFLLPNQPNTVFVWQIGVSKDYQGQGIGTKLLENLLKSESCRNVQYLEATISPSNKASQMLFTGLARKHHTDYQVFECFPEEWFPSGHTHEEELTYRIGPFS